MVATAAASLPLFSPARIAAPKRRFDFGEAFFRGGAADAGSSGIVATAAASLPLFNPARIAAPNRFFDMFNTLVQ